ncbi:uncharacterized protein LOC144292877 isoform X2 [Canis aureus]
MMRNSTVGRTVLPPGSTAAWRSLHLQTFRSTCAPYLAHSDLTLPLSPVAQDSHSPQFPNSPTLPSTPVNKEEALTQQQVTAPCRRTRKPCWPCKGPMSWPSTIRFILRLHETRT